MFQSKEENSKLVGVRQWTKTSLLIIKELAPICEQLPWVGPVAATAVKLLEIWEVRILNMRSLEETSS